MLTLTKALLLTVLAAAVTAGSQLSCWGFAAAASAAPASAPAAGSHGVQPQPTTGYHRRILSIIQELTAAVCLEMPLMQQQTLAAVVLCSLQQRAAAAKATRLLANYVVSKTANDLAAATATASRATTMP
jgi:hypothetical protein